MGRGGRCAWCMRALPVWVGVRVRLDRPCDSSLPDMPCSTTASCASAVGVCTQVGKLVEYTGHVVYAPADGSLRVRVEAHLVRLSAPGAVREEAINEFHFIFRAPAREQGDGEGAVLPEVLPETYEEGMLYLEGRRRWHNATCRGPSPSLEEEGGRGSV